MKKINVFIDNIHNSLLNEDKILKKIIQNSQKILKFFLSDEDLISQSCVDNYAFQSITFDILLCDDIKIQELNKQYRNKDKPTDVLSFAIFADVDESERFIFDDDINIGEIIISLDTVKKQAPEFGFSFEKELYFLVAHGILHLLGFDHQTEDKLQYMLKYQEKVLEVINV